MSEVPDYEKYTFEQLAKLERGTLIADYFDDGVRVAIMRGGASLTAYVGCPKDHPLAGFDYDSIPLDCHGGLTYSGQHKPLADTHYWYGWDYAHLGDLSFYDIDPKLVAIWEKSGLDQKHKENDTKWTLPMVKKDIWSAIYEFKKLMHLAEKIKR